MGLLDFEKQQSETDKTSLRIESLLRNLAVGINFGTPIDVRDDGLVVGQRTGNLAGSWVTLTLTAATGNVAVTHNLDLPAIQQVGGAATANLPNVRWLVFGIEYGDRSGTNAAPAAPAAF